MNCEQVKYQMIDLVDGILSESLKASVEDHIENCSACQDDYIQTGKLLKEIANAKVPNPSLKLKTNFYKMLEAEKLSLHVTPLKSRFKKISFGHLKTMLNYAAQIVVLLSVGAFLGYRYGNLPKQTGEIKDLQNEISALKQNMSLVSLNQPSASMRIQAINNVNKKMLPDVRTIDALINTMNTDGSVNVRMAAMYALARYGENETVRMALIASLTSQSDPLLQITLINILVGIQDERAKQPLQNILKNKELPDEVKKQAELGLKTFI